MLDTTDYSQFSFLQKLDIIILCIQAQYHYQNFMVDYKHYLKLVQEALGVKMI